MSKAQSSKAQSLRSLPAIDDLLRDAELADLRQQFPHAVVAGWIRNAVETCRQEILDDARPGSEDWREVIIKGVRLQQDREVGTAIQEVINATGIILHTNLGRAPLAKEAIARVVEATGYSNVELDLHSGKRSHRGERACRLLQRLTSAEDAVVVNNCAAATILVLNAVAAGREVVVARGQLVEIGGGFRLPDVFRSAGVVLREVGTTNRTYLHDYEDAIGEQTGAVIRVHHSNFRISGFVTEPTIAELVTVRRPSDLAVIDDLGSGWIADLPQLSLQEPSVAQSVQAGADLTLFSGDKLFGGPQCGIIVGRSKWIERLRRNPLMRAFRVDKLTLAALEATAEIHLSGDVAERLPTLAMLAASPEQVHDRCVRVQQMIGDRAAIQIVSCQSQTGGGSVPGTDLPSYGLRMEHEHPDRLAEKLRGGRPAIQARIHDDSLLLDLRTVTDEQCLALSQRLRVIMDD